MSLDVMLRVAFTFGAKILHPAPSAAQLILMCLLKCSNTMQPELWNLIKEKVERTVG